MPEIPEVNVTDPRARMIEAVEKYKDQLKAIYEAESGLDEEIMDLAEEKYCIETLILPELEGNNLSYVQDHIDKTIGTSGTYGITEGITYKQSAKDMLKADKKKLAFLIQVYEAILYGWEQPECPEQPEEDPDALCSQASFKNADFHYCVRPFLGDEEGWQLPDKSKPGDTIVCENKYDGRPSIRLCVVGGEGNNAKYIFIGDQHDFDEDASLKPDYPETRFKIRPWIEEDETWEFPEVSQAGDIIACQSREEEGPPILMICTTGGGPDECVYKWIGDEHDSKILTEVYCGNDVSYWSKHNCGENPSKADMHMYVRPYANGTWELPASSEVGDFILCASSTPGEKPTMKVCVVAGSGDDAVYESV